MSDDYCGARRAETEAHIPIKGHVYTIPRIPGMDPVQDKLDEILRRLERIEKALAKP